MPPFVDIFASDVRNDVISWKVQLPSHAEFFLASWTAAPIDGQWYCHNYVATGYGTTFTEVCVDLENGRWNTEVFDVGKKRFVRITF